MGKPLKVLIVEDKKEDEELLLRELQKAGYDPLSERVENSREMSMALDKQEWDMVFSDYIMPAFSGLDAVKLLRGKGFAETPFVIVSGSIGEVLVVEALKSGVNDYLFKDNFLRLANVVEQELALAKDKKKLRDSREVIVACAKEWEETFNATKDSVMLLDAAGKILNCNKATQELLNKEKADILNKHCYEVFHELPARIKGCPIERMRETKHRESMLLQAGEKIFEITVFPIFNDKADLIQVVHVVSSITERKRAEEELRLHSEIMRNLSEGVALIGINDGIIRYVNPKLAEMFGFEREELNGKHIAALSVSTAIGPGRVIAGIMADIDKTGEWHGEVENIKKDGTPFWCYANCSVFNHSAYGKVIVIIYTDITARKEAEDVLKRDKHTLEKLVNQGTAELMKTQKELADIKRLSDIGQLAATVAHELRNPLGVIKTAVYNLRKKAADSAFSKHFDNIDIKIAESDLIIQNLLDYSRIKMPQYEKVAVNDILKSCIEQLRVKYAKWDVEVEIKFPPGENIIIEGDSLHLSELFTNILDNSYQAFPDKKGRIELEAEYNSEKNRLDMKFKDNGIGIEDKDIEKVFEPFYTNKPRGVGLGLTVCKQLVLFHGGTLVLSSKKGAGTTVFLSLPVRRA